MTGTTKFSNAICVITQVFVGPRYTENIDLNRIVECPKLLALAKGALSSLKQKPDVHELAFPAIINCLLDCLHQQEHFQVLTDPTSQLNAEVYLEEMASTLRRTGGLQSTSHSQRRSGTRRGAADDPEDESSQTMRPGMHRRLAGVMSGFVRLELVRQTEDTPSTSAAAAPSSKKSPPDSPSAIWARVPTSTSLYTTSLFTASRLRNQLLQRIMINTVMHTPEGVMSREMALDPEDAFMVGGPLSLSSSFMQRRRGGTGSGGGRRGGQDRSDARPDIAPLDRDLFAARREVSLTTSVVSIL